MTRLKRYEREMERKRLMSLLAPGCPEENGAERKTDHQHANDNLPNRYRTQHRVISRK